MVVNYHLAAIYYGKRSCRSVKGQQSGSVAQLPECSYGKREAMGLSPGRATIFPSPVTFGGLVWVRG